MHVYVDNTAPDRPVVPIPDEIRDASLAPLACDRRRTPVGRVDWAAASAMWHGGIEGPSDLSREWSSWCSSSVAMLAILVVAGAVVAYVVFPHRGDQMPVVPWLGDAMGKAVDVPRRRRSPRRTSTSRSEPETR